ncbi:hypothetical protein [Desertibaculum subflavum]|uniref:hypothetical protein n=1 Tax=Desertibaculum subflavum TaxID=2268458 RepID=UPI000E66526E
MTDSLANSGEIGLTRLVGRIVAGDQKLPSIDELTELDGDQLQFLHNLLKGAIRSGLSAASEGHVRKFSRERLAPALRLKLSKAIVDRARALIDARSDLMFLTRLRATELHTFINSAELFPEKLKAERKRVGPRSTAMIDLQVEFIAGHLDEFSDAELNRVTMAMALVEVAIGYDAAEAFFQTYGENSLEKDSGLAADEGETVTNFFGSAWTTSISPELLSGKFSAARIAAILMHELVHVGQPRQGGGGNISIHLGEGRPYGVDWAIADALNDDVRRAATEAFMRGGLLSNANEVADYCVTCVAASVLGGLRVGTRPSGLPSNLQMDSERADRLFVELVTSIPDKYSTELMSYLNDLGRAFPAAAPNRGGWINRNSRIPAICRFKEAKSTLFDQISDGTFALPPPQ